MVSLLDLQFGAHPNNQQCVKKPATKARRMRKVAWQMTKMMLPLGVAVLLTWILYYVKVTEATDNQKPWSYTGNNGPENWSKIYNDCGGKRQSPVEILTKDVTPLDSILGHIAVEGYDKKPEGNYTITNNGHSIEVDIASSPSVLTVNHHQFGRKNYSPVQFHFHWGGDAQKGSEHKVDGKQYEMEMHIVHKGTDQEDSHQTGLIVIGLFIKVGKVTSPGLKLVAQALKDDTLKQPGGKASFPGVAVGDLLFELPDEGAFYTYSGSLTTPPCSEIVTWILMKEELVIAENDIELFREVLNLDGKKMVDNFRPVQALNKRMVYSVNL